MFNKLKKTWYADDFSYFIRNFGVFTLIFSAMTLIILQVMHSSLYTSVDEKLQALLKRSGKFNENTLTYGDIVVNLSTNEVKVEDTPVELLGKEFELLVYFLQNQNVILPKTQIFDRLWGFDSDTTISVVEVYVSKVRKKLKGTAFAENLQTLRSVGYILKDVQ